MSQIWLQRLVRLIRFTALVSHMCVSKPGEPKGVAGGEEVTDLSQSCIAALGEPNKRGTPENKGRPTLACVDSTLFFRII